MMKFKRQREKENGDRVEFLATDYRASLSPAQMVEQKLIVLLRNGVVPLSSLRTPSVPRTRGANLRQQRSIDMANQTSGEKNQGVSRNLGQAGADVKNRVEEITHRSEEAASSMIGKAKDAADDAYRKAAEAVTTVGERAESAASAAGSKMSALAGTIRETMPREGVVGSTSESVAGALESGGRYLQEQGFSGMLDDMSGIIRRNPLPAILVGISIGFLLARTLRS
jgi:hypothetical protein